MVSASVSAYTAPSLMAVCLLTDYWIYGKQTRLSSTTITKAGDMRVLNFTYHRIGLWRECMKEVYNASYNCDVVRYSKAEAKMEKGFKAVSYRSAPSMACFTAASALLVIAIFLFSRGLCKRRRKAVFFISGLLFSISGLLTMVGVTLYVSITTEESVKIDQDYPVMQCFYGFSFLCAVLSFVLQELTGVLTVYWFIYRFRALVRKQEKLRERTRRLMGTCLSMTTALTLNPVSFDANNNNNNRKPMASRSNNQINQLNYSNSNDPRYQYMNSDTPNSLVHKQQTRRLPFDKSTPSLYKYVDKTSSPSFPPRSPTLLYGDYCRVLIRAEDMDLLTKMVKSRSQAHLIANSRPATPATTMSNVKILRNSHTQRQITENTTRRSTRKGVKRTTSV
ncbi:unnamed protein product [Adineta steineri]|uniref:Voltage-dependent calcium channel gamma-5 subunit n=1 Tax=Adineta steineri TaxID=433720 RepID=A0A813PU06_9BILA|nr:unnamed protein product [Adineta steineri]CAF0731074.1 unnamed protein product [Adineta steineri]CAF0757764.1 unnamed protein product [Adineta steineri]CAF3624333.1 unnamed protein product [Adineta steineri]CAF3660136.1 unnamed protein product [Adineta steineri]